MKTADEVLAYWGHSPCDCGCRAAAERIAQNERLRQAVDGWGRAPQTSDPRVSQEAKLEALRDVVLDALTGKAP
jgi:hypothetical protein